METNRTRIISRLADQILAVKRPHPVRVAVDGRSAAGKSTLVNELVASIEQRGYTAIRASIDDFYQLWVHQFSRGHLSAEAFYAGAYDYPSLLSFLLEPLGPHRSRQYRTRWHDGWHEGAFDELERIAPDNAILTFNGVFLLRPDLNSSWDVRVFVDTNAEQNVKRGVARDLMLFEPAVSAERRKQRIRVYRERYLPAEERYLRDVEPKSLADVVVDNRDLDAPRLIVRRRQAQPGSRQSSGDGVHIDLLNPGRRRY